MPVISPDGLRAGRWWHPRTSWSFVRDGEWLELAVARGRRVRESRVTVSEWQQASCVLRQQFEKDRRRGAGAVVGVPVNAVLVRTVGTPLKNRRKAEEVLPSVLDTKLPVAMEQCEICFGPIETSASSGLQALGVAARHQELQREREEWETLGVEPDWMLAEVLAWPTADSSVSRLQVWCGEHRAWWVLYQRATGELLCGGVRDLNKMPTALVRFLRAHPTGQSKLPVLLRGPGATKVESALSDSALTEQFVCEISPAAKGGLATQLGRQAGRAGSYSLNLAGATFASSRLARKRRAANRGLLRGYALLTALLGLTVFVTFSWFDAQQRQVDQQMTELFEEVMGRPARADEQGLEADLILRALRERETSRTRVLDRYSFSEIRTALANTLSAPTMKNAVVRLLRMGEDLPFEVRVVLPASDIEALKTGWAGSIRRNEDGSVSLLLPGGDL